MSDQEAWHELCNLYLMEGDYAKAAFCMEEVLLHNPFSHLVHQRLGDIRYTMGGQDNIEIAKSYYAQAIKLNGNNLRALYGLYLVSWLKKLEKTFLICCFHSAADIFQAPKRRSTNEKKLKSSPVGLFQKSPKSTRKNRQSRTHRKPIRTISRLLKQRLEAWKQNKIDSRRR